MGCHARHGSSASICTESLPLDPGTLIPDACNDNQRRNRSASRPDPVQDQDAAYQPGLPPLDDLPVHPAAPGLDSFHYSEPVREQ